MADFSQMVWEARYQTAADSSIDDMLARAVQALRDRAPGGDGAPILARRFIPNGRLLISAGSPYQRRCLVNTLVLPPVPDELRGAFSHLRDSVAALQSGAGIGMDFSDVRARGAPLRSGPGVASGPASMLPVWNEACAFVQAGGVKRGAMMASLSAEHPDVLEFVAAKADAGASLVNFNLSVRVSDRFCRAVRDGSVYTVEGWGVKGHKVDARHVWQCIAENAFAAGEPGLLYPDRANRRNALRGSEVLTGTNSCGEQWLPAWGSAVLGSFDVSRYVTGFGTDIAGIDLDSLHRDARAVTPLMDAAVEESWYPDDRFRQGARRTRRLGLGVFGFASALVMLGVAYGSERARCTLASILDTIRSGAVDASLDLAERLGPFPGMTDDYVQRLGRHVSPQQRQRLVDAGIRNSHLTCCPPAGLTSAIFDNVSSGIEPVFAARYSRAVRVAEGPPPVYEDVPCEEGSLQRFRRRGLPPPRLETAADLSPMDAYRMHLTASEHVDAGVSKTVAIQHGCHGEADVLEVMDRSLADDAILGLTFMPMDHPSSQVKSMGTR